MNHTSELRGVQLPGGLPHLPVESEYRLLEIGADLNVQASKS